MPLFITNFFSKLSKTKIKLNTSNIIMPSQKSFQKYAYHSFAIRNNFYMSNSLTNFFSMSTCFISVPKKSLCVNATVISLQPPILDNSFHLLCNHTSKSLCIFNKIKAPKMVLFKARPLMFLRSFSHNVYAHR